jgi:hypothetical protein
MIRVGSHGAEDERATARLWDATKYGDLSS